MNENMSAIAAITAIQKRYILNFKNAGAIMPERAIVPAEFNITTGLVFDGLVRRGIIVPTTGGRYFLDEEKEAAWTVRKQKMLIVLVSIVIILLLSGIFIYKS